MCSQRGGKADTGADPAHCQGPTPSPGGVAETKTCSTGSGVRTHAGTRPLDLKSNALTTRPSRWLGSSCWQLFFYWNQCICAAHERNTELFLFLWNCTRRIVMEKTARFLCFQKAPTFPQLPSLDHRRCFREIAVFI